MRANWSTAQGARPDTALVGQPGPISSSARNCSGAAHMAPHHRIWRWNPESLWQICCGFLGLEPKEFIQVQQELLLDKLALEHDSMPGRRLLRVSRPPGAVVLRGRGCRISADYSQRPFDTGGQGGAPAKPTLFSGAPPDRAGEPAPGMAP